jgi:ABC-2 type transport system permease protein
MSVTFTMMKTFLRILSRDRQALFFSLFFPLLFMFAFSFGSRANEESFTLGFTDLAGNELSDAFIKALKEVPEFSVETGNESDLREKVVDGEVKLLLILPPGFQDAGSPAELKVVVDKAQVRELGLIMPMLEQVLVQVERQLRGEKPLFSIAVEDVKARAQNYLSFLVPGLLAFTVMQIAIAGSGYNIVEYRRKGILKRLFVTPLRPSQFIGGLVLARGGFCLVQLSVLLLIAVFGLEITLAGPLLLIYVLIILGTAVFLCIGFAMGSLAKTQQSIMALGNLVTFPQMFLSGIFYPIDVLPELVQPIANALPLSFVARGLREVIVNGAGLVELVPQLLGLLVWLMVSLLLAVRLFKWKVVAA